MALTGAGVSTESGIPDFRGPGGLWTRFPPGEYATLGAFLRTPDKVWRMLRELEGLLDTQPNAGHRALAALEHEGGLAGIITQNIDGLHQAAGSRTVVEFHGSGRTFTCISCKEPFPRQAVSSMPCQGSLPQPPDCTRGVEGICLLKPDVVLFDEDIPGEAIVG
ncbi:MAG: Sir2 family NAD-dependent protein deacetylase, partial [Deltaproteobacteria bacterium]|nr:Sir2 family NAD-dependent protein deacetylase [Deltaproteobacteria bacterium]